MKVAYYIITCKTMGKISFAEKQAIVTGKLLGYRITQKTEEKFLEEAVDFSEDEFEFACQLFDKLVAEEAANK